MGQTQGKGREHLGPRDWRRHLPVAGVGALGITLSFLLFALAWTMERERVYLEFMVAAENHNRAVQRNVELTLDVVRGLHARYASAQRVEHDEFGVFVEPFLARYPGIHSLGWAQRIGSHELSDFLRAMQDEVPGFVYRWQDVRRALREGPRDHYPLVYLEPSTQRPLELGTDISLIAPLNSALQSSVRTGRLAASGRYRLQEDPPNAYSYFALKAVFPALPVGGNPAPPDGVVFGLFRLEDLATAIARLRPRGLDVYLFDESAPAEERFLYYHPSPLLADAPPGRLSPPPGQWQLRQTFEVGGRTWSVVSAPAPGHFTVPETWLPAIVLGGGLLFTLLLCSYLWTLKRQGSLIVELVDELEEEVRERQRAETHLQRLAHHDMLTGLPNRVLFTDRLDQALAHAHRMKEKLAILYLDLDGFKEINDTLGHDQGDKVLVEVAQRLRRAVRSEDTVSRLGGDEFTILLRDVGVSHDVTRVTEKIQAGLATPVVLQGRPYPITASIGISVYPDMASTRDQLLRQADQAMYQAKRAGKRQYRLYR